MAVAHQATGQRWHRAALSKKKTNQYDDIRTKWKTLSTLASMCKILPRNWSHLATLAKITQQQQQSTLPRHHEARLRRCSELVAILGIHYTKSITQKLLGHRTTIPGINVTTAFGTLSREVVLLLHFSSWDNRRWFDPGWDQCLRLMDREGRVDRWLLGSPSIRVQ